MTCLQSNISLWEQEYATGRALRYPDSVLVSLAHRLLSPTTHRTVLDYGCGSGNNLAHFVRCGYDVTGADVSPSALELTRNRLESEGYSARLIEIDGTACLPFTDGEFDAVIAWQVIDYNTFDGLAKTLSELRRITRPGGVILATISAPGDVAESNPTTDGMLHTFPDGRARLVLSMSQISEMLGKTASIGKMGYSFNGASSQHWIVVIPRS